MPARMCNGNQPTLAFSEKVNLREFSSQTVGIDASCWIHRALYVSISERGNRER